MNVEQAIAESHRALAEFAQGNPEPVRRLYSHSADATLANPFGYAVRGWADVSEALGDSSSRFHGGSMQSVERVAMYQSSDLVTLFEIEKWQASVGEISEATPFELRVSTTWRREEGEWKIAHRHADPIRTFDASGPLRAT